MKARAAIPAAILVSLAILLTGCSSDPDSEDADAPGSQEPGTSAPATPSEDPPDTAGGDLSPTGKATCDDITDQDVAALNRDWGRVAGGVGRPDIAKYTKPLVSEVEDLTERASGCPGSDHAEEMSRLIGKIDRQARTKADVNLDDVNDFQTEGNAWLAALGYGESALSTG